MRWQSKLMLSAAAMLIVGCAPLREITEVIVGDYCDVAAPFNYTSTEVADYVVDNDPDLADSISVHNRYGKEKCDWEF